MLATIDQVEERVRRTVGDLIRYGARLLGDTAAADVGRYIVSTAKSVAANQRAARRARSPAESAERLLHVRDDLDACVLWLEIAESSYTEHRPGAAALLSDVRPLRKLVDDLRRSRRR